MSRSAALRARHLPSSAAESFPHAFCRLIAPLLVILLMSHVPTPLVAAPYWFSPDGCGYKVRFPDVPKIKTIFVPEFGEMPEAEIDDERGLMRANCITMPSSKEGLDTIPYYGNRSLLLELVRAYFAQNGVQNAYYTYENTDIEIRVGARGTKMIQGTWLTVETFWYVSPQSSMTLVTAHISKYYPTKEISDFLASVSKATSTAHPTSRNSTFITRVLPFNVSVDVPRSWWVLDETVNELLRTSLEAALNLHGIVPDADSETLLFAANSWPPTTYASIRITRVTPIIASPDEIQQITPAELQLLVSEIEEVMKRAAALQGHSYLETLGVRIEEVGSWPALIFSYRRSGPKGPVVVQLLLIMRESDSVRVSLAYRETESALWRPVIERIKRSIKAR